MKDYEYPHHNTKKRLLKFPKENNEIQEEIKSIQKAIAMLRQDFPIIIRNELMRFKGNGMI
jgi:hypothetical protein